MNWTLNWSHPRGFAGRRVILAALPYQIYDCERLNGRWINMESRFFAYFGKEYLGFALTLENAKFICEQHNGWRG